MGVYNQIHDIDNSFKASETNTYNDYFSADWAEYRSTGKTRTDVYREHLQTASKDKLIDLAIEGHKNYEWANDLAWDRGIEIEELNQKVAEYNAINQEIESISSNEHVINVAENELGMIKK